MRLITGWLARLGRWFRRMVCLVFGCVCQCWYGVRGCLTTGCPFGYLLCLREAFGFLVCLCRTLGPRYLPLHLRHLAFRLAKETRMLDLLPLTIRIIRVEPHVNAPLDPSVLMRLQAANGDTELAKITVRSSDNAHAFAGGQGRGGRGAERLVLLLVPRLQAGADQSNRSDTEPGTRR